LSQNLIIIIIIIIIISKKRKRRGEYATMLPQKGQKVKEEMQFNIIFTTVL
jgi:hypothetical protein